MHIVECQLFFRELVDDLIGGDHIARGGLGVHKGKSLSLEILQGLDIAVTVLRGLQTPALTVSTTDLLFGQLLELVAQ